MSKVRLLIADDDPVFGRLIESLLKRDNYAAKVVNSLEDATAELERSQYEIVLQDLCFPALQDGFAMLEYIRGHNPKTMVLMISGAGHIPDAIRSIRLGAVDFIEKPLEPEHLLARLQQLRERISMEMKLRQLEMSSIGMVGTSAAMKSVFDLIIKAAHVDCPVLITGENGVGKELAANAIHRLSRLSAKPMTVINCAGIPRELFESELFGYEQGAFTGAAKSHTGYIEFARDSSFFMDEISELPYDMQAKLLRVISAGEIQKVGGKIVPVNTRIISASNRDLETQVVQGIFRNDLFYRLNTIHIKIPPLRERREDIPMLVELFLHEFCGKYKQRPVHVTPEGMQWLVMQNWPGNVRELRNAIERVLLFISSDVIKLNDLRPIDGEQAAITDHPARHTLHDAVQAFEREYITQCLRANNGLLGRTARELGVDKSNLSKKLSALGIRLKEQL